MPSQVPNPYNRSFNFSQHSANQPFTQQPGQEIDQELNNARSTINATLSRLNEIQRDDGKIRESALDTTAFNATVTAATATATAAATSASNSATSATASAASAAASATSAANAATNANNFNLQIGTVTTLAPGSQATTTVTGSLPVYTLNFGIPQGAPGTSGATGATGATGPQGPAGINTWGSISGSLSSQVDLQGALDSKANLSGASFTGNVTTTGRAGIGGGVAANPDHKLAIYNGNVVFSAGYGIAFGDGTNLVSTSGLATTSSPSFSGTVSLTGSIPGTTSYSYVSNQNLTFTQEDNSLVWYSSFGVGPTNIGSVNSDLSLSWGHRSTWYKSYNASSKVIEIEPQGIYFDNVVNNNKLSFANGTLSFSKQIAGTAVSGKAGVNIGIGGTDGASTTPGDLWITTGGVNLNFRDANGSWRVCATTTNGNVFSAVQTIDVSNASSALRVTQRGTGNAIVVEDSTTPDSTSFVVDNDGKLAVGGAINAGAAPHDSRSTFYGAVLFTNTGTFGSGSIKFRKTLISGTISTASFSVAPDQAVITNGSAYSNGNFDTVHYPNEIVVVVNGSGYAVPARPVPLLPN